MYRDQNDTWVDRYAPTALKPYLKLIRIDRPIGTWLVLLPGYWGLAIAAAPGTLPSVFLGLVFTAGAFVMRSAGCTLNDMWDRRFDAQVARTSQRPLARGSLSMLEAWAFLAAQGVAGLSLLLTLPPAAIGAGFAIVPVVALYPALKRVTYLPQVVLGMAMNWGVVMGWAAVQGGLATFFSGGGALLYGGAVLWTIVYDTVCEWAVCWVRPRSPPPPPHTRTPLQTRTRTARTTAASGCGPPRCCSEMRPGPSCSASPQRRAARGCSQGCRQASAGRTRSLPSSRQRTWCGRRAGPTMTAAPISRADSTAPSGSVRSC